MGTHSLEYPSTLSTELHPNTSPWHQKPLHFPILIFPTLLLLLSCFSSVRLCVIPKTAAHQAPPSLGFSRQEHWSGLPFPSPMGESEKWKVKVKSLTHVWLLATPWTAAYQAPPSVGFLRCGLIKAHTITGCFPEYPAFSHHFSTGISLSTKIHLSVLCPSFSSFFVLELYPILIVRMASIKHSVYCFFYCYYNMLGWPKLSFRFFP